MKVECPGTVVTDAGGAPLCTDGASGVVAWVAFGEFDPADIDAALGSGYFAAGFVIVASAWAIGRGARLVLSMLK